MKASLSLRITPLIALAAGLFGASASGQAASLPEIRVHAANAVPACVTPDRLMQFLADRNQDLDHRLRDIAHHYKLHGEALRVRWDYAFFQMVLETNHLKFRTGSGRLGDAKPRQLNFAGLGTTGGGVPGESFKDVATGVRAHLEHLVAYSGEKVAAPVARRTAENQDDIIKASQRLRRPVRFSDLQMRWAIDRGYAMKIDAIASRFLQGYCTTPVIQARPQGVPAPIPVHAGRLATSTR